MLQLCTSGRKAGPQSSEQQLYPLVPSPGCSVLSRPAFPGCPCLTHPEPKSISVYTNPCPQVSNPDPSSPSPYQPLNKGSRKDLEEETRSRLSGKFCSWAFRAETDWERPGQRVAGSGLFMYRGFSTPKSIERKELESKAVMCKRLGERTPGHQRREFTELAGRQVRQGKLKG